MGISTDVIIVGAGPGGAALAYLLASRGHAVCLLERHQDFAREFRGEGFQPSGVDCIRQMGLSRAFASVPQVTMESMRLFNGRRLLRVPIPSGAIERPRMVAQPAFLEMMTREAATYPGFELRLGSAVADLIREGDRVRGVRLAASGAAAQTGAEKRGGGEIRARLVVGADGRGSVVRRATGLEVTRLDQTFDILWTKVDLTGFLDDPTEGRMEFAGRHPVLVYPSPEGNHQMGVVLTKGRDQLPDADRWGWILDHVSADLSQALRAAGRPLSGPVLLKVACDRLEEWSRPGVLLIGDAAHTMSPVGGQGVNMALRDAVIAANHLVPALASASNTTLDRACRAIAEERLPEIREVQDLQTREGARLRAPNRFLLRVVLPLLARMAPGSLAQANRRRRRMRMGLTEVRLTV